ncbi:MAG: hypothetical protein WCL37_06300 [Chrysiogenales bacterium]
MKNKGKRLRLFMGLTALAAFFIFQGASDLHSHACFSICAGADLPDMGSLKVFNKTMNHISILLIPMDSKNGTSESFQVRSPLQNPEQSIAIKLMPEGEYVCLAYLIGAVDNTKRKYIYGEMVNITMGKQAEVQVVSNDVFY